MEATFTLERELAVELGIEAFKPTAGCLTVVVPVYNEETTVRRLVESLHQVDINMEIIVVDDGSSDGTRPILEELEREELISKLIFHEKNMGKGAALQSGFEAAGGDWVIVQDADLEYDPKEIPRLLAPIVAGKADVVYGSRFTGSGPHRVLYFWHYVANRCLTLLSNMFTNLNLTDMETCYKIFRREVISQIQLREKRFGVEPEITAKVSRIPGVRIYEVGISYAGRTYEEGKKITWRDGIRAFYCILRYRFFR